MTTTSVVAAFSKDELIGKMNVEGSINSDLFVEFIDSLDLYPGSEISVPTSSAYKECNLRFPIIVVDEFRTTRVHHEDDSILEYIRYK